MAKKIKTGTVNVPIEDFDDENITAHISIRLPLNLVKDLKRLALNEDYEGRYQVLVRDILQGYADKIVKRKRLRLSLFLPNKGFRGSDHLRDFL